MNYNTWFKIIISELGRKRIYSNSIVALMKWKWILGTLSKSDYIYIIQSERMKHVEQVFIKKKDVEQVQWLSIFKQGKLIQITQILYWKKIMATLFRIDNDWIQKNRLCVTSFKLNKSKQKLNQIKLFL